MLVSVSQHLHRERPESPNPSLGDDQIPECPHRDPIDRQDLIPIGHQSRRHRRGKRRLGSKQQPPAPYDRFGVVHHQARVGLEQVTHEVDAAYPREQEGNAK